jgi:hypothetical protein
MPMGPSTFEGAERWADPVLELTENALLHFLHPFLRVSAVSPSAPFPPYRLVRVLDIMTKNASSRQKSSSKHF